MTNTRLDRFYLIVDDASWIARLVPIGVKLVQLRIKDRGEDHIRGQIRDALKICAAHQAQLIINDYWKLAIEEGCDFIHLGQEDLQSIDLAAIRRAGLKLGVSTHDHDELAYVLPMKPDYVALGPIYSTKFKAMRFAPQGLERIGEWKKLIGAVPLVAIGGLTVDRAAGVLKAGADILSVVTDVTLHIDPKRRVAEWLSATRDRKS